MLDIGKFLNGYSQKNYNISPKGWDHVDALVSSRNSRPYFSLDVGINA